MRRAGLIPFQRAQPFTPFFVKMADETRYEVRHPELIAIGEAACIIFLPGDAWVQLDIARMTEVGPIVPTGQPRP